MKEDRFSPVKFFAALQTFLKNRKKLGVIAPSEINNKEKKKVSEESYFQRKQRARITTSVFAFLANESTALL